MKINRVILITGLVVIVFAAVIGLFVLKTFTFTPSDHYNDVKVYNTATSSQSTSTTQTQTVTSLPQTDTHSALDDCIELKANEAKGKQYEKGSLLVTFVNDVAYGLAAESVAALGLKPDTSTGAEDNFNAHHWLTVYVPSGEEFKWQCTLDTAEGVKKANLNITFKLVQ